MDAAALGTKSLAGMLLPGGQAAEVRGGRLVVPLEARGTVAVRLR